MGPEIDKILWVCKIQEDPPSSKSFFKMMLSMGANENKIHRSKTSQYKVNFATSGPSNKLSQHSFFWNLWSIIQLIFKLIKWYKGYVIFYFRYLRYFFFFSSNFSVSGYAAKEGYTLKTVLSNATATTHPWSWAFEMYLNETEMFCQYKVYRFQSLKRGKRIKILTSYSDDTLI